MNHCKAVDAQPLLHTKRQEGGPGAALRRLPTARQRVVLSQPCGMASQIPAACYALISPRRRIVVRLARAHPATALRPQPNPPNPALPRPARPPSPSLLPTLLTPAHDTLPHRSAGKGHCACGEGQHHRPDDGLHIWAIWISLIFQACSIWDHWDIKTAESCKTLQKYISLCFEYAYPPKKSAKPS